MAFTSDYLKINLRGTVLGGDVWNTGFHVRTTLSSTAWTYSSLGDLAEAWHTNADTWWTAWKAFNYSGVAFTGFDLLAYSSSGSTTAYASHSRDTTAVNGTGANQLPNYVSCVNSLKADEGGRHGRGRMYVPCTSAGLTGGQFGSTNVDTMAAATLAMLQSVNSADWSTFNVTSKAVTVVSRATSTFHDVKRITLDSLPDVQHRRTNRINPTYLKTSSV